MKRVAIAFVLFVVGAGAFVFLRPSRTPPADFVSIKKAVEYQDASLLKKAMALPVAEHFTQLLSQTNPSACGPASVANVFRSAGEVATQDEIAAHGHGCAFGVCFGGLSLEQLADAARDSHHGWKIDVLHPADAGEFRELLMRSANDPDVRLVINFDRFPLFGTGGGHHSPIGAYLEEEDLVLVLDVNEKYQPWLVRTPRLFEAMNTFDGTSKRGLIRFTH
ncbi:MAG: phytochelatin synthase family protein [Archangium sp.]